MTQIRTDTETVPLAIKRIELSAESVADTRGWIHDPGLLDVRPSDLRVVADEIARIRKGIENLTLELTDAKNQLFATHAAIVLSQSNGDRRELQRLRLLWLQTGEGQAPSMRDHGISAEFFYSAREFRDGFRESARQLQQKALRMDPRLGLVVGLVLVPIKVGSEIVFTPIDVQEAYAESGSGTLAGKLADMGVTSIVDFGFDKVQSAIDDLAGGLPVTSYAKSGVDIALDTDSGELINQVGDYAGDVAGAEADALQQSVYYDAMITPTVESTDIDGEIAAINALLGYPPPSRYVAGGGGGGGGLETW